MAQPSSPKTKHAKRRLYTDVDPSTLNDKQLLRIAKDYGVRRLGGGELKITQQRLLAFDVQVLTTIFGRFTSFRHITLSQCLLRDQTWLPLAHAMLQQRELESLDIRQNMLTNDSVMSLTRLLEELPNLRHLDFRKNSLDLEMGVKVFEEFPQKLHSLNGVPVYLIVNNADSTIKLANFRIQTPEAAILGKALEMNRSITSLSLAANQFNKQACEYIISALIGHPNLTQLDLSRNNIIQGTLDLQICPLLEELAATSKKLTEINLTGSNIPPETLSRMEDSMKVNRFLLRERAHRQRFGVQEINPNEYGAKRALRQLGRDWSMSDEKQEQIDQTDLFCGYLDELLGSVEPSIAPALNPKWKPSLEQDEKYMKAHKLPRQRLVMEGTNYFLFPDESS